MKQGKVYLPKCNGPYTLRDYIISALEANGFLPHESKKIANVAQLRYRGVGAEVHVFGIKLMHFTITRRKNRMKIRYWLYI